jgi:hypothetical protein
MNGPEEMNVSEGGGSCQELIDDRHEALPFFEKGCVARILEFVVRDVGQLFEERLDDEVLDEILRAIHYQSWDGDAGKTINDRPVG